MVDSTIPTDVSVIALAEELVADGRALEAIAELSSANRREPNSSIEQALVRARHAAWEQTDRTALHRRDWSPVPDYFPGETGIPEVAAAELDPTVIRSALVHHGALLVRGLLARQRCEPLREAIDRSWGAIERFRETNECDPAWFDPLREGGFGRDIKARMWGMVTGTAYVPDSPRLLFQLLEALDETDIKSILTEYFGETPVISLAKTAHRRFPPDASGGWHQDAAVYGMEAHALDVWVPVSRCGDVAPGLTLWPRRLDRVVETVGPSSVEFGTSPAAIEALTREVPPVCPVFKPGDAAIIDELTLHSTHSDPNFTQPRYGFEVWFFAPSTFPDPELRVPIVY
jgi:hypothetical protein